MPLSYLVSPLPSEQKNLQAKARAAMYREEVCVRIELLRRLGHSADHALHRCLVNLEEEFRGSPPVKAAEVRKLVKSTYGR